MIITNENAHLYTTVDKLVALTDAENESFHKLINTTNVKKYYIGLEFSRIDNPEYNDEQYYSLNMMDQFKRQPVFTSQINNISMHMPSTPILYKWNQISKVTKLTIF